MLLSPSPSDWLSCLHSLSTSERSRLNRIMNARCPRAIKFADDPLGYCRESFGVVLWVGLGSPSYGSFAPLTGGNSTLFSLHRVARSCIVNIRTL